jgi:TonB family protein
MNGSLTLKIFLSISLGLHLLFFSISSLLFPDFKVNGFRNLNLEVSLLPLISETKALPQNVRPETHLRTETSDFGPPAKELVRRTGVQARPMIYEQSVVLRKEKKEEPVYKKEQEPESPLAQPEMKVVSISNPSAVPSENEKRETGNRNEEGIIMGLDVNPHSQTGPPEKTQIAMKNPSLSGGEILFVQPKYAENPKPIYPNEARRKGYEGEVILRVEVLPNGRVGQIGVRKSSGYELLDRSALATVKQWKFIPAKKGEASIPLWVNIPVKFQLQ